MNLLHYLQEYLRRPIGKRQPEPEFNLVAKRPDPPVASILRDLDEIFGLDLVAVGRIISSGKPVPYEETISKMMDWAKGFNTEFDEKKYLPRLKALKKVAPLAIGHPALNASLEQALTKPLPVSIDENQRSVAVYIQFDDFAALRRIQSKLLE